MKVPSLFFLSVLSCADFSAGADEKPQQHSLEDAFLERCQRTLPSPPDGFYSAYLEQCDYRFYSSSVLGMDVDACGEEFGTFLGAYTPNDIFVVNLQESIESSDSWSSDDIPNVPRPEDMMMWPDQCVAVIPRCYLIKEGDIVDNYLTKLFADRVPEEATHVRVDCRNDANAASEVIEMAVADFVESTAALIALSMSIIFVSLVLIIACIISCFRLCFPRSPSKSETTFKVDKNGAVYTKL